LSDYKNEYKWEDIQPFSVCSIITRKIFDDLNRDNNNMVNVLQNNFYTVFYNNKTISIDKNYNLIKVWVKRTYSQKGKTELNGVLRTFKITNSIDYLLTDHSLLQYLINYGDMKYIITDITYYSAIGYPILEQMFQEKWNDIKPKPDSIIYRITSRIVKDYSLK
jgi:hypothetical protein